MTEQMPPAVPTPGPMAESANRAGANPPQTSAAGEPVAAQPSAGISRNRPRWWVIAAAVLALATAFCAWFAYPARPPQFNPLPPGATWIGDRGIAYTVVARNHLQVLDAGSNHVVAPPGAVIVQYIIQVDNYVWPGNAQQTSLCLFDLYGRDGMKWSPMDKATGDASYSCAGTPEGRLTTQQVQSNHLIPERELAGLIGLVPKILDDDRPDTKLPVISEPH